MQGRTVDNKLQLIFNLGNYLNALKEKDKVGEWLFVSIKSERYASRGFGWSEPTYCFIKGGRRLNLSVDWKNQDAPYIVIESENRKSQTVNYRVLRYSYDEGNNIAFYDNKMISHGKYGRVPKEKLLVLYKKINFDEPFLISKVPLDDVDINGLISDFLNWGEIREEAKELIIANPDFYFKPSESFSVEYKSYKRGSEDLLELKHSEGLELSEVSSGKTLYQTKDLISFVDNLTESFNLNEKLEEVEKIIKDPRKVPVWFGTNRVPIKGAGLSGFTDKWSRETTTGMCVVNVPKGHKVGSTGSNFIVRLVKGDDRLTIDSFDEIEGDAYWHQIKGIMSSDLDKRDREALFFLHGYNVSFEEAALRTAQLSYDLKIYPAVFFSWPSGGDVDDYQADEAAIEASYDAISDFVRKLDLAALETGTTLHVLAHSMGNRALLKALEAICSAFGNTKNSSIDKVVFAAPDVDARVFMQSLDKINDIDAHKTLYCSKKDRAVWLSKVLHKYPRAGLLPPVTVADHLDTIDATDVDSTFLGHSYFSSVRALLNDLSALLKGGLMPSQRVGLEVESLPTGETYWRII